MVEGPVHQKNHTHRAGGDRVKEVRRGDVARGGLVAVGEGVLVLELILVFSAAALGFLLFLALLLPPFFSYTSITFFRFNSS